MANFADSFIYNPNYHRLSDFLGIDKYKRDDYDLAKKIFVLYKWGATKSKSQEVVDIYKSIINFKKKMGTTFVGEPLVKELYKWIRLDEDKKQVVEEGMEQEEELTQEQKEIVSRKRRVAQKKADWNKTKRDLEKQKEETAELRQSDFKRKAREIKSLSREQKTSNIRLKKVKIDAPKTVELEI